MKRKPCEGRNTEDSEADLYAEFHGNHGDETDIKEEPADVEIGDSDRPLPRHRRVADKPDVDSAIKGGSRADRFKHLPDLSNSIQVKFTGNPISSYVL